MTVKKPPLGRQVAGAVCRVVGAIVFYVVGAIFAAWIITTRYNHYDP